MTFQFLAGAVVGVIATIAVSGVTLAVLVRRFGKEFDRDEAAVHGSAFK